MKNSRYHYAKRAAKPDRTGPDGFVYDSKTEMLRALDLQLLEKAGVITNFERQKSFDLTNDFDGDGAPGRITIMAGAKVAKYTPDFVYKENGRWVIEDVKGYPDEASKFRIRVFEALYGYKVDIWKKVRGVGWVKE